MNRKLTLILTALFISIGVWQLFETPIYSQNKPLTLDQVINSLTVSNDKKKESAITAKKVRQVGVTFPLQPLIEANLRAYGATNELIRAIRQNSPSQTKQSKRMTEIIVENANLRESPNASSQVIREVAFGEQFFLSDLQPVGAWYMVLDALTGKEGWIHGNTFKKLTGNKSNNPKAVRQKSPRLPTSTPKPSSVNLGEPKILWADDCDPRTSPNQCQLGNLAILSEFYDAVKSVNGTITYRVPNSKQELESYAVVILDFCFGAANDNSINVVKQYIQSGGSAFIMGGNFCIPGPNGRSTAWWASQLTKDFGVTFTSDDDSTNQWADSIDTLDVKRIYSFRHAYLNVASPSKSIITIKGRPIAAIYDGTGTFVAVSDEIFDWGSSFKDEIASSDNFVFWRNALKWLISQSKVKRPKSTSTVNSKEMTNSIGMEFVKIPSGEFMMGSNDAEIDEALYECKKYNNECKREVFTSETPKHRVTINYEFYLGKFEVTQAEWQVVMGDNPSKFPECGANCPVENVRWDDIQVFLKRLNSRDSQFEYRLPTEAEWEYAARAGTTTAFAFGYSLNSSQANFNGNYPYASTKGTNIGKTVKVGSYQPNAWGFYDMHGNVYEWVQDIHNSSYQNLPTDGSANLSIGNSDSRVVRGGSWLGDGNYCRSARRPYNAPANRDSLVGFRLVANAK